MTTILGDQQEPALALAGEVEEPALALAGEVEEVAAKTEAIGLVSRLQKLADSIEALVRAATVSDLRGLRGHTETLLSVTSSLRGPVESGIGGRSFRASPEMAMAEHVITKCRLAAAFLRRARRTNDIFARLLSDSGNGYSPANGKTAV